MCLTISQPFYAALICGQCLNNVHGKADYSSCFEIGGRQMEADKPCGKPPLELHICETRMLGGVLVPPALYQTSAP